MEFGTLVYFYVHSEKAIATEWNIDTGTLFTWLSSLCAVLRNDYARHTRIKDKKFLSVPSVL